MTSAIEDFAKSVNQFLTHHTSDWCNKHKVRRRQVPVLPTGATRLMCAACLYAENVELAAVGRKILSVLSPEQKEAIEKSEVLENKDATIQIDPFATVGIVHGQVVRVIQPPQTPSQRPLTQDEEIMLAQYYRIKQLEEAVLKAKA